MWWLSSPMPLLKTRSIRKQFAQNYVLTGFEYFHRLRFHKFPMFWSQCLTILTVKKFLNVWVEVLAFQFASVSLVLSLLLTKSLALVILHLSGNSHTIKSPPVAFSSWTIPALDEGSYLRNILLALHCTLSSMLTYFFVFRKPELDKRLKLQAHIPWLEGNL